MIRLSSARTGLRMKPELRAYAVAASGEICNFSIYPCRGGVKGGEVGNLIKRGREEIGDRIRVGSIIPVIKNGNNIKRIVDGRIGGLPRTWRQRQKDPLNR